MTHRWIRIPSSCAALLLAGAVLTPDLTAQAHRTQANRPQEHKAQDQKAQDQKAQDQKAQEHRRKEATAQEKQAQEHRRQEERAAQERAAEHRRKEERAAQERDAEHRRQEERARSKGDQEHGDATKGEKEHAIPAGRREALRQLAHAEEVHRTRMARILRLKEIAQQEGKTARLTEIQKLEDLQREHYEAVLARYRDKFGDEEVAAMRGELKSKERTRRHEEDVRQRRTEEERGAKGKAGGAEHKPAGADQKPGEVRRANETNKKDADG